MKEIEAILELYRKSRAGNKPMALATVVNKFGSAYRRPGARMLITSDGDFAGSISGGCIERDLIERSSEFCSLSEPRLLTYRAENGDPYDFGSGCEGVIYTLLEPLNTDMMGERKLNSDIFSAHRNAQTAVTAAIDPIEVLETVYRNRVTAYSATVFLAPEKKRDMLGRRVVQFQDGAAAIGGSFENSGLFVEIMLASTKLFSKGPAFTKMIETGEGTFGVFFEKVEPPVKLLIFGAGDDVKPLSAIAHTVGLNHSIVDYRPGLLTEERFPLADKLLKLRPEQYATRLITDEHMACVIIHHHYDSDKAAVQFLLENTNVGYIGVLGPKKRTVRMLTEMQQRQTIRNLAIRRSSLFAPVGLDIGAETPEEIALSIVAEIKAFYRSKTALLLRDKDGPIHDVFDVVSQNSGDEAEFGIETALSSESKGDTADHALVEYVHLQCQI
jgi:xanthine/CO dehydrogenase XdhC/CoxF family maturation factor